MRWNLALVLVVLSGCPKKEEPAAPSKPTPPAVVAKKPTPAEVEFMGTWKAGAVKAAKVVFVAQVEPCVPAPEKATRYGEQKLDLEGELFAEFFPPQGSKGHACVYAYDAEGKLVGVAGTDQNPLTFEGEGEVIKSGLQFELQPL